MKKILLLLLVLLASCSLNKVVQHHGVHNLEKKQAKLKIEKINIFNFFLGFIILLKFIRFE